MTFDEADRLYPYDPRAVVERLHGIAKLRAFDDPSMRRSVFELWKATQPKGESKPAEERYR